MNIREFFHSTIRGDESAGGEGLPLDFKCFIMCAYDVRKEFDWITIHNIRRVSEIRYYSDAVNTFYQTNLYLKRVFSYDTAYPQMLAEITDYLLSL